VFDTGANLSVLTASLAGRLRVRMLPGGADVRTVTGGSVRARLAVADSLHLGGVRVRNVVFLVFEDRDLAFPQIGYQIHGILGFPVIAALGRVTLSRDGGVRVEPSRPDGGEPNLAMEGLSPVVAATYAGVRGAYVLDSGATATQLLAAFDRDHGAALRTGSTPDSARVAGAGGVPRTLPGYRVPEVRLEIGGQQAVLVRPLVVTAIENEGSRRFLGRIGQDVIRQFGAMTLDFAAMRLVFHPAAPAR